MYHLIFCDDDEGALKQVSDQILHYCRHEQNWETEAVLCTKEEEIFEALMAAPEKNTIVFLDICMGEQENAGILLARKINEEYPYAMVVYLTGYLQYVSDVYETEHCYFLLKDEIEERLPVLFGKIIPAQIRRKQEWLNLPMGTITHRIWQSDILYMERILRKTTIHLVNGEIFVTGEKLDELNSQLSSEIFIRCHNSFIVNVKYVREINRQFLVLSNGDVINVSRSYATQVKKHFSRWGSRNF